MNDPKTYAEKFELDMPLTEALDRFVKVTSEELLADVISSDIPDLVPEGEMSLVPFKGMAIRKVFHESEWWFSIVDVVAALTGADNPRRYWSDLKRQMVDKEGFSELYDFVVQLKMEASDGKMRDTDAANPESLLRIIQSIRSPRAEPFKRWLARVGYERIQEIQDPEIAIKRAIMAYQLQGRSMDWIEQRIRSITVRKELTAEWKKRGVDENHEFAILTALLSSRTFGVGPADHKKIKRLQRNHNLRDHMTDLELILTQLAEKSTKEIAQIRNAQGFEKNRGAVLVGGDIAGTARKSIERETGQPVVSSSNFLPKRQRTFLGNDKRR